MSQIQDPFPKISGDTPLYLQIRVVPRQSKTGFFALMEDGTYKMHIKAVPEKWKANAELISFFADYYRVRTSEIEIISGASDRTKLVRILKKS